MNRNQLLANLADDWQRASSIAQFSRNRKTKQTAKTYADNCKQALFALTEPPGFHGTDAELLKELNA